MIDIYNKIKNTPGKLHGWYNSSVGIIKKPNSFKQVIKQPEAVKQPTGIWDEGFGLEKVDNIMKQKNMNYSFGITLKKGIVGYVLFFLGVVIAQLIGDYPQVFDLTLGAVLLMVYNFIKIKLGVRLP